MGDREAAAPSIRLTETFAHLVEVVGTAVAYVFGARIAMGTEVMYARLVSSASEGAITG